MPLAIILVAGCGTGDKLTPAKISDAPTGLVATAISKTEIGLTWKDNSSDEDGFNIERKEGPWGGFQRIALVGADVTTYHDRGSNNLTPNTTYYYRVAYYRGNEVSEYSMAASATTLKKSLSLKKTEMIQLSPYVGIVLRLLTGEADLINEDKILIPEDGSYIMVDHHFANASQGAIGLISTSAKSEDRAYSAAVRFRRSNSQTVP